MSKIKDLKFSLDDKLVILMVILAPLSAFLMGQYILNDYFSLYNIGITLVNYLIISGIMYLVIFITNKYNFSIIFIHIALFIYSCINYYLILFRGNPVLPWDLIALNTAMDVVSSYTYIPTTSMIISFIYLILVIVSIYYLFPKRSIRFKKENIGARLISLVISFLSLVIIFFPSKIESFGAKEDVWDQAGAYKSGGSIAVFFANTKWLNVEVPEGYSSAKVDEILSDVEKSETLDIDSPNIIVIMNESWSDLEGYGNIELSESVIDKIKSIEGIYFNYAYASVSGAGTSASEYEFLTSNSMAFLPSGSIPYQQYVLDDSTSLASILKDQGYYTMAFHPGDVNSWNRNNAYPLLGFDEFKSRDDMDVEIREAHGGYVSDESNFKQIIYDYENYDKSKPLFYFNVSIQSHGGYMDPDYKNTISVKGHDGEFPMAEQYLTLVNETDEAFYNFIEYFKGVDEPVLIVMFGDHKPALEEEFYELVYNNGDSMSMAEYLNKFKVPYVIWANYDLGDLDIGEVSLNYLGQYVLELSGNDTTVYGEYLKDLKEVLPVIAFPGYFDSDYEAYSHLETNSYTILIKEYQIVQYDNIFNATRKEEYFNEVYH